MADGCFPSQAIGPAPSPFTFRDRFSGTQQEKLVMPREVLADQFWSELESNLNLPRNGEQTSKISDSSTEVVVPSAQVSAYIEYLAETEPEHKTSSMP